MTISDTIIADIQAAARHVPFGHSAFQIAAFTGGEHGPERRHRTLLLNMDAKLKALRECRFRRRRLDVDLREIAVKLAALTTATDPHGFTAERLVIDRDETLAGLADEDKLIEDAIIELQAMHREWKSLPALEDRGQFEAAEAGYWARRLWSDACREIAAQGAPAAGTLASLQQMGLEVRRAGTDWQVQGPSHLIVALPGLNTHPTSPLAPPLEEITDGR